MKKERIVGLCICVVLLASLQSLFFVAAGWMQLGVPACSRAQISLGADILPSIVCAGWPHLGFLYGEFQLLQERIEGLRLKDSTLQAGRQYRDNFGFANRPIHDRKEDTSPPAHHR